MKLKIEKVSNKKDKKMVGLLIKVGKEVAERIDQNTLKLIIAKYGKKWVEKVLRNQKNPLKLKDEK